MPSETGAAAAVPAPTFFRRHRWKIILIGLVVAAALVAAAWTAVTLTFSYSSGDRVG